jgi:hypothetical protein
MMLIIADTFEIHGNTLTFSAAETERRGRNGHDPSASSCQVWSGNDKHALITANLQAFVNEVGIDEAKARFVYSGSMYWLGERSRDNLYVTQYPRTYVGRNQEFVHMTGYGYVFAPDVDAAKDEIDQVVRYRGSPTDVIVKQVHSYRWDV